MKSRIRLFMNVEPQIPDTALKKQALDLLDCLTCPHNEEDPEYDVERDIRRDNLLAENDYLDLKVELRRRGLRSSGDKLEMITRLLLHVIDPNINYNEMTGQEPNLKFITNEDISTGEVKVVPENERRKTGADLEPDAEDMQVLRRRRTPRGMKQHLERESGEDQKEEMEPRPLVVMDGLVRREISLPIFPDGSDVSKNASSAESMSAYVVSNLYFQSICGLLYFIVTFTLLFIKRLEAVMSYAPGNGVFHL